MGNSQSLDQAIRILRAVSGLKTDVGMLARELLPLLRQIPKEITGEAITRPTRRGTGEIAYLVETTQQGEVLTEERLSGKSKAFRCPRAVYEAVTEVLSFSERPLLLDEIVAGVKSRLGDRPADHQVRVALRLWLHVESALVTRSRARYRIIGHSFAVDADSLWNRLKAVT